MKILAIICEFNPFHNGHKYVIGQAKRLSGCDAVICIMSGSFTQRGEICRTDKFLRAGHAVKCGADAVIELPAPFAVSPAEIFAQGAINVISSVKNISHLAFGCESGSAEDFINTAHILLEENNQFKKILTEKLDGGESYIKSCCAAFARCGGKTDLLNTPNNILAVEYAKAIVKRKSRITLLPVQRIGADYNDGVLRGEYASAGAIRANAAEAAVKAVMPDCSYEDYIKSTDNKKRFERFAADCLFTCDKSQLKRVYGCTEGLENRLKALAEGGEYGEIVNLATSKRYPAARITRILAANALGLYADETQKFLSAPLQPRILAVKKQIADDILPLLNIQKDMSEDAVKCELLTSKAYSLWRHLSAPLFYSNPREKMIFV